MIGMIEQRVVAARRRNAMPLEIHWPDIAIRILSALIASGMIGLNRTEHGHAAGLRTSILVCLAACVAMIQVNLLLPLAGRPPNSFVMNDLMRLPLGILSGMGFIGAGAIVRRDNLIAGVTTAATLWLLTVIGLCFGGGQVGLGWAGAALAMFVLSVLKLMEEHMTQAREGTLSIVTHVSGPDEEEIHAILNSDGFRIASSGLATSEGVDRNELKCDLRWRSKIGDNKIPDAVRRLRARPGVMRVEWSPKPR
jgi:putative Mg2+ transporter-C (MgtC) family protein